MEDDLEFSWGDRVQPGAGAAVFLVEDGVARASVDAVARPLCSAMEWFLGRQEANSALWVSELRASWKDAGQDSAGISALSWYLDSSPVPKALTEKLLEGLEKLKKPLLPAQEPWLGRLSPEVAMFGDLSPPHFHSEVQHRPFPQRGRSPSVGNGRKARFPAARAPRIRPRDGCGPVCMESIRAFRAAQRLRRVGSRPSGRREGVARPEPGRTRRRNPVHPLPARRREAVARRQGGRALCSTSAGVR